MACKVLVVGSSGNIGAEVVRQLRERPGVTVVEASRSGASGVALDINDIDSIVSLDEKIPGGVDHVVVCCGASTFGPLAGFDSTKWTANCTNKLIAISRLVVMFANNTEVHCLKEGGSITVTAGQASRTINKMWPGIATNNAGLEAFVRNAGLDLPRGVRCNAVSPALVYETAVKAGLPLVNTVRAAECAEHYVRLIFSTETATVVDAGSQAAFVKNPYAVQKGGIESAAASAPSADGARVDGVDYRGQPSSYSRSRNAGVIGLLAYDVADGLSCDEYDQWLYDVHYHDLLANPHLNKIVLRTVCADKKARLSSGAAVTNALEFYRLAELYFDSHESYDCYTEWFQANVIPPPRTPAGKSAFKFYLLSEGETIER